ncbi:MAG: endolytic transglycosylase MltG [Casimicrobiaceae bacterium]
MACRRLLDCCRLVSRSLRFVARSIAALTLVAGAMCAASWWWLAQPLALPSSPFVFDVKAGATLKAVARDLAAAKVLPAEWPLVALARVRGVDRGIKAGNYEIEAGITLPGLLERLTQGDVTEVSLTIVEGSTFGELRAALAADAGVAAQGKALSDAELMAKIGAAGFAPEGWFFPDTYFFAAGSSDVAILARAHRLMLARLDAAWAKRAPDLPLKSPYEALILASIVEKETGRPADRPLIASVFVNRLKAGMRLQTDPTVIYGMGKRFDGNLRKRDLETDTPYNTYTRDGLPPTPIALPGQASIDAVTNPPPTPYLYFVARGDGASEFSANLADHNRAVAKFQKGVR